MTIKRRKPAAERKTVYLRVRISESHEKEIKDAAIRAGIGVSAWAIERLLKCARQENAK
jgi:hypothetical protein